MIAVIRMECDHLSLRQICQRFDAIVYHDRMLAAVTVAGTYNTHGGIDGSAVNWTDLHPAHQLDDPIEMAKYSDDEIDLAQLHAEIT